MAAAFVARSAQISISEEPKIADAVLSIIFSSRIASNTLGSDQEEPSVAHAFLSVPGTVGDAGFADSIDEVLSSNVANAGSCCYIEGRTIWT